MNPLAENEIIIASAGSGKTWRLTLRFIRLLTRGVKPERIIALTFSRKAAGEFFDAILNRLAKAAATEEGAAQLAADLGNPALRAADFRRRLADLIHDMPRLMLATLDSFFVRVARAFPFELGLSGDFSLLDTHMTGLEQNRVLHAVFRHGATQKDAREAFLNAFQMATWGKEDVKVRAELDRFIGVWHERLVQARHPDQWGNPERIWGKDHPFTVPPPKIDECLERLKQALERDGVPEHAAGFWEEFFECMKNWRPGNRLPLRGKYFIEERFAPGLARLKAGNAEFTVNRKKQTLTGPGAEAALALTRAWILGEIKLKLVQTHGIYRLLRVYEDLYKELVRQEGRLTFQDVQFLLSGDLIPLPEENPPPPPASELPMEYRLDARYDHWLLDEFQDTSRLQWRILHSLVDEVIQDNSGLRSFFAVGDPKQSIHVWREAEPRLFHEILSHYNRNAEQRIKVESMPVSRRSCPAVIEMVNTVLTSHDILARYVTAAAWKPEEWPEHESHDKHLNGCAAMIQVPDDGAGEDPEETDPCLLAAAELLKELHPSARGLSCAIVTPTNRQARECADELRRLTGLNVLCDTETPIAYDNPACAAIMAAIKATAHPADVFSWRQVCMSPPLLEVLRAEFEDGHALSPAALRQRLRPLLARRVAAEGFGPVIEKWTRGLLELTEEDGVTRRIDSFSAGRLRELCRCAAGFDSTGNRDADEFAAFARSWRMRESGRRGAVQVMTIHRSKGLTFDVVLLIGMDKSQIVRDNVGRRRFPDTGAVDWLLNLPGKEVVRTDPVLSEVMAQAEGERRRELLCQLYVALTRARYANYIILPKAKSAAKKSSRTANGAEETPSFRFSSILRECLGDADEGARLQGLGEHETLFLSGDPAWYRAFPKKTRPAAAPATKPRRATLPPARDRLTAELATDEAPDTSREWFVSTGSSSRSTGNIVHAAFAKIERLTPESREAARTWLRDRLSPEDAPRALSLFDRCLDLPEAASLFAPASPGAEIWRERSFDLVLPGRRWVTGTIDRAVILRDAQGRALEAELVDFKTGGVQGSTDEELVAKHLPQITVYRDALVKLTGLPPERVRCRLFFTSAVRLLPVEVP